jgi:hypothetical protein
MRQRIKVGDAQGMSDTREFWLVEPTLYVLRFLRICKTLRIVVIVDDL